MTIEIVEYRPNEWYYLVEDEQAYGPFGNLWSSRREIITTFGDEARVIVAKYQPRYSADPAIRELVENAING